MSDEEALFRVNLHQHVGAGLLERDAEGATAEGGQVGEHLDVLESYGDRRIHPQEQVGYRTARAALLG